MAASGIVFLLAGVALVESWRRGLLDGFIGTLRAAARGQAERRPFRLPTDTSYIGGGTAVLVP